MTAVPTFVTELGEDVEDGVFRHRTIVTTRMRKYECGAALGILVLDIALALIVHLWQRLLAYVILLGGIFSQVVFIVAAIVAVN